MFNFYDIVKTGDAPDNPNFKNHGVSVPFRAVVAAPSGAGKTNQVMNLIVLMDKVFSTIIICVKSADEPLYQHLIEKLKDRVEVYENGDIPKLADRITESKESKEKRPKKTPQTLIIFDDLMYDKSPEMLQYWIRGRKFGYSPIFVAQNYYGVPIDIRKNSNYIFLGRGLLRRDIKSILALYPSKLTVDQFAHIYEEATKEPLDVLLVDTEHRELRYNITEKISDF
jgi:hypothetical protein